MARIIVAKYWDGWTERLLGWTLVVNDGEAHLVAEWRPCEQPLDITFPLDDGP